VTVISNLMDTIIVARLKYHATFNTQSMEKVP
jgi:hypothetical protein